MERYYFKCTYCERPLAIDCERAEVNLIVNSACPLCGFKEEKLRIMGRVEAARLKREGVKAACDARCTNAVGPRCDCLCNHANHGSRRLVVYEKNNGVLTVTDKKLLEGNEEYLAEIAELVKQKFSFRTMILTWLENKYAEANKWYAERTYDSPWNSKLSAQHWEYANFKQLFDKIEDYKTIKKKVDAYAKLFEQIRIDKVSSLT